jgi:hypothetical protein
MFFPARSRSVYVRPTQHAKPRRAYNTIEGYRAY